MDNSAISQTNYAKNGQMSEGLSLNPMVSVSGRRIIISGPCAAETPEQIRASMLEAKVRDVDFMRISLWKPRTKPGFDGIGEEGIDLLVEAAKIGINPATEVLTHDQAQRVVSRVLKEAPNAKILIWIGARNQNHYIQREIAKVAASDERIYLMVKNQPWRSQEHWEGIIEHVLDGGIPKERLILCHRGFVPNGENPNGYRNIPDFAMAMEIREKTGLPMVFDPSHTGGTVPNVMKITGEASDYAFDGLIVEVHHDPKNALTDAKQQVTWKEFDALLSIMG